MSGFSARVSTLDTTIFDRFMAIDQGKRVLAEYVWIGGNGHDLRSKTKVLEEAPKSVDELPIWNFDGSSTNQAPGHDSEVLLKPVRIFNDPFRGGSNILVLCECLAPDMTPIPSNTRNAADAIFKKDLAAAPWYGIEQEFCMFESDRTTPFGWPKGGYPRAQGPYYCGAGVDCGIGRYIIEAHLRACLHAGIKVSGINAEVFPGQWEYQVGPVEGIAAADHLWMSRYILHRVAEEFGVYITFDPKPVKGDWNGSGCHTNFSTKEMREEGGYAKIISAIEKLAKKHKEHIEVYGSGNEERLTGHHETASIEKFSYGVANRGASIRIPRETERFGKGYFEDRRPAANMDPYLVTSKIFDTISN